MYGYSYSENVSHVIGVICSIDGFTEVCNDILGLLCGYDSEQADLVSVFCYPVNFLSHKHF